MMCHDPNGCTFTALPGHDLCRVHLELARRQARAYQNCVSQYQNRYRFPRGLLWGFVISALLLGGLRLIAPDWIRVVPTKQEVAR